MTSASPTRTALRRTVRLGFAGAALLAAVTGAAAEDGLGGFLSSIFGTAAQQPAPRYAPSAEPAYVPYRRARPRPLVVRLKRPRPKLVALVPSKPGKVSIYEDPTLRRGDAVMTADGVRVFAGSTSWPYVARDFVRLKDAKDLDRGTSRVLAQLDKLPRG